MSYLKISVLSIDLSDNSLGRAYILAKVLKRRYDVEIIGPMFGQGLWEPLDPDELRYFSVPGRNYPFFFNSIRKMLKSIDGDVVYAIKPRPTSYGIGLLTKLRRNAPPLVLDIDDWEVGSYLEHFDSNLKLVLHSIKSLPRPNSYVYTLIMEKLTFVADDITVSTKFLQNKFGGTIVPHCRDTDSFDPKKFNRESLREEWKIQDKEVIMFLGTPLPNKGLEEVIKALKSLNRPDSIFMIVGAKEDKYTNYLKEIGGNLVHMVGIQPFSKIPEFLSMADLVVLPLKNLSSTIGKVPSKVFDAMAMEKPIIATRVSDLPEILDGCGLIVEPGDVDALAERIEFLLENENFAKEIGKKAREKCVEKYSWDRMEEILTRIFDKYDQDIS